MASSEVVVAIVALVISVIAFLATFMQVLQGFLASAAGYAECNEEVMGKWSRTRRRHFNWEELRFEVSFESPVIFVCPPKNTRGPRPGLPIMLTGDDDSLRATCVISDAETPEEWKKRDERMKIVTADNERASWFVLMEAVQRMEHESRVWQQQQYVELREEIGPPTSQKPRFELPPHPPSLVDHHTFTVALQRKWKSWDTMPPSVTKPYATTTMCHLVEMMAGLGIYWKEFDRTRDRYRAEGNGFTVIGEKVSDLGLLFSFRPYGKYQFKANRVIPVDEVKGLCFGFAPTIYNTGNQPDYRRLVSPGEEAQDFRFLSLGSRREVAETLVLIGCNNKSVRYYLGQGRRTSHLFPLSFEILGMLSQTFHVNYSYYTCIPNPTPDRWDRRSVSMIKMLQSFRDAIEPGHIPSKPICEAINSYALQIIDQEQKSDEASRLILLQLLHTALEDIDEILTARRKDAPPTPEDPSKAQSNQVNGAAIPKDMKGIPLTDRAPLPVTPQKDDADSLKRQSDRQKVVQDVLRAHLQEVLRQMNYQSNFAGSDTQSILPQDVPGFESIDDAGPDNRESMFMDVYFNAILPQVVKPDPTSAANRRLDDDRRQSLAVPSRGVMPRRPNSRSGRATGLGAEMWQGSPFAGQRRRSRSANGTSDVRSRSPAPEDVTYTERTIRLSADHIRPRISSPAEESPPDEDTQESEEVQFMAEVADGTSCLADLEVTHSDLWCTLVFRMICWLMLHEVDKQDVQISKSELVGSRMPVYIS